MPAGASLVEVFRSRKMACLFLLGFSSGMPLYLTGRTLQAWLTVEGVDLTTIGLLSLVGLPYSFKFLWSPLLDRYSPPFLGRRRGWMSISQLLLLAAIAAMAFLDPSAGLTALAMVAVLVAFLSATQDIVIDAYSADVLERREMGAGAGVKVLGYRIAMLWTGAAALILADRFSWPAVYLLMAASMTVGLAAALRGPEPERPGRAPASLALAIRGPFQEFWNRFGAGRAAGVLVFVAIYKLGDAVVGNMTTPFLLGLGFTQTDVGVVQGGLGLVATIAGILIGGALLSRWGILRSLWVFGLLQAATNVVYIALAQAGAHYPLMVATLNLEYFAQGLGTSALVAFLLSLCHQSFSATQYALLSSFMAFSRDIGAAPAGGLVEWLGWPGFFALSVLLAAPGLALLAWLRRLDGTPDGAPAAAPA